jgi:hypothetical protein
MALIAIKNCNTLPMIQSVIQNSGGSLEFRATQINFEVVLGIRECVKCKDGGDVNLQLSHQHD